MAIPDKSTQGHVFATSPPPLRLCHNVIARERSDRSNLQLIEKQEIATLPSVARNDKKRIMTQPLCPPVGTDFKSVPRKGGQRGRIQ
ncbi:MAG: hypothetical protein A2X87_05705 [Deltaproteobacteria bacterium GWC2_42_51]|nr:MAG: hypothetical protein A2067_00010 [Deltaproteobacteria bacterium GWB2_42_7]OGP32283.1 MAG: hypothetical protein A2X87_05705 [Deltaproteobacteria bacterium GWC2_42_51]OGQ25936.1 MAG: hypothetical protein A3D29_00945 [Deltaproteobacteria bacterium RIFCSPHIGHO2_02_FULL_42_44]OGQ36488.1 MAG: hypothetical protein A3H47_05165 [Deltaproteobacteria bacterium RIFCSPLOWO2_02_FULL_42_39]OGQ73446.1 MAG: hypothetical protein A2235_11545 [Deltaproteobacteria bacterium RIFOXYA2_FULL_42_10]